MEETYFNTSAHNCTLHFLEPVLQMPSLHSLFSLSLSSLYTLYPLDLPCVLSLALLPFFTPCPSLSLILFLVLPHVLSLALLPFFTPCPHFLLFFLLSSLYYVVRFPSHPPAHLTLPTLCIPSCPTYLHTECMPSCTPSSLSLLYSLLPSLPAALPVALSPVILLLLRNLKSMCLLNSVIKQ